MTIVIVSCIVNSLQLSIVIVILPLSLSSSEKGLITKEHIVTDTNLTFVFIWAVHFSTLAVKLFNSGTKLF